MRLKPNTYYIDDRNAIFKTKEIIDGGMQTIVVSSGYEIKIENNSWFNNYLVELVDYKLNKAIKEWVNENT